MKRIALTSLIVAAALGLAACGKKAEDAAAAPDAAASAAADKASDGKAADGQNTVRQATYDPNLRPTNIVWDSPEKKKAWEERQRAAGHPVPADTAAPAAPAAAPHTTVKR